MIEDQIILYGIRDFHYLLKYDYVIVNVVYKLRFETLLTYESRKRNRRISIGVDNSKFSISISRSGEMDSKNNFEIIESGKRDEIAPELKKHEESGNIEKIISFYSGYFREELHPIVMGEKWFDAEVKNSPQPSMVDRVKNIFKS